MRIDRQDEGRGLLDAAVSILQSDRKAAFPEFARDLFGRVPAEDLAKLSASELADLAQSAYGHLGALRPPGTVNIRLIDGNSEGSRELTVVEVVNDNMPFLFDSTLAELIDRGYEPGLVAHPILAVERDGDGRLIRFVGEMTAGGSAQGLVRESLIHIHLPRIDSASERQALIEGLEKVYADVAVAVRDWQAMRTRVLETAARYRMTPPPLPEAEVAEAAALLEWLADDNFTLLGLREYHFPGGDLASEPETSQGYGILSNPDTMVLRQGSDYVAMTPEIRAFLGRQQALIITKANVRSRVHRRVHFDYIGIKLFDANGRVDGELRLIGLFTSSAYTSTTRTIPYLRRKVEKVLARAGFDRASYSGRALTNVLENYPRDELFHIDPDTLYRFAIEIMNLAQRPRIRVLAHADEFGRFISVLVFVPKDHYDTQVRIRIGEFLARIYGGRVSAAYPSYPDGPLSRTLYIIGHDNPSEGVAQEKLEEGVAAITRTWGDSLAEALASAMGGIKARKFASRYGAAFSAAYREAFSAEQAIGDIAIIERMSGVRARAVDLYRREGDSSNRINLKVFSRGAALPLSERVPMLEKFGFRVINERTYRVVPPDVGEAGRFWLHDMTLERASGAAVDIAAITLPLEAAILAQFRGLAESDGFSALVLEASLGWRDVAMLRAFGRYLQQIRIAFGQGYLAATLARYGSITARIAELFYARFDPRIEEDRDERQAVARAEIEKALRDVASLDDDRILRSFVNLVNACVRTNFFQLGADGLARTTIAFKFECARIDRLPLPRPLYEIFVYSPRVEGIHMRFGKVARGGLRWSDRPQDFRTEVLGLAKAQQVKNAVIVPVGAKGGFVPKALPPASERQAWLEEGTESYRIFIRTLLQLTDNIVGDSIVAPLDTVRHDGDDPYLVVAADKGTATFSDVANALSIEKGHWLGDAFASGGSHGYDHKKMGITARGAWEAIKRHFREINIDIQTQPVLAVGVGDMSGDVFGNGMLRSKKLKLVAAFDHRDIFLDPDPDPETAWEERQRLFDLPRSSWADYDREKVSAGGGVFSRQAKSVPLSPRMREILGIEVEQAPPNDVITAILKAPVDLLWFGGIGTYIRSSAETDDMVGDRANDAIRICGREIRAKVVGEGANLGSTQRGRIEAARNGVRLNTDAIDNSAGVNTSDIEVNIKIALAGAEKDGRLSADERNSLLVDMTDDVSRLVLRNNYLQTLSLSLTQRRGVADLGFHKRQMQNLEQAGRLDRSVEYLPDDITLTEYERHGDNLSRPELAVMLAYAKLSLYDDLLQSKVPDDPYFALELEQYFPVTLIERFPRDVTSHRLRREIIATRLANTVINRCGPSVIARLSDETGADASTITTAYTLTRDVFQLQGLNEAIDALDGKVDGDLQLRLYAGVQDLTMSRIVWFVRNIDLSAAPLAAIVSRYREGISSIGANLDKVLAPDAFGVWNARKADMVALGVPDELAGRLAALPDLLAAPDVVMIAEKTGRSVLDIARTHFAIEALFQLGALATSARDIVTRDYFDRLALDRANDAVFSAHRRLTAEVVAGGQSGAEAVQEWSRKRGAELTRIRAAVGEIISSGLTVSKFTVAASMLGDLPRA